MNQEYLSMFIDETKEHLQAWSDGMLDIEKTGDTATIPQLFRAAHTIKGMSMTMGFNHIGEITHHAENLLDGIRNQQIQVTDKVVEALFHSLDALEKLLAEIEEHGEEKTDDWKTLIDEIDHADKDVSQFQSKVAATVTYEQYDTDEIVRNVADRAMEQGYRVYEFEIGFDEGCVMSLARWAQVRQLIDENSLLFTDPEPAVLDGNEYNGNIRFVLSSTQDIEEIASEIDQITEVKIVGLGEWVQSAGKTVLNRGEVLPKGRLQTDGHVQNVIKKAMQQSYNVYEVGIRLYSQTQLKAPRIYMVFEAIGGQNHLLFTNPKVDKIEREEFEQDVQFIMWSNEKLDRIKAAIDSVSEIDLVELREWKEEAENVVRSENQIKGTSKKAGKNESGKESKKVSTIRVDTDKLDELMNLFSELVIDKTRLEVIKKEVSHEGLQQTTDHMSRVSNQLQELIMSIRMIPVESVFQRFPRMVRDTAKQVGKEVEFEITGEDTELDRTVVDSIGDPIMHMLRNSLDHGLEPAEQRIKAGKPDVGKIDLRAYASGNYVIIEVADDGAGINRDKVFNKAVERGIIQPNDNLTDQQVYQLLFASGFSTADAISDLSGRGVGLDVVKSKIEALSGKVEIQSRPGKGTKFIIQLPMTLAIITGLQVIINGNPYLLPIGSISEVTSLPELKTVNGKPVTVWRGEVIGVRYMTDIFNEPRNECGKLIVVHKGNQHIGIVVDDVIGQLEVVLKSLEKQLKKIKYFSGATILGDGSVSLILDANAVFED